MRCRVPEKAGSPSTRLPSPGVGGQGCSWRLQLTLLSQGPGTLPGGCTCVCCALLLEASLQSA